MKPPYIVLLNGGPDSKKVYAISNERELLTIPIFTDGILCNKYIKSSAVKMTPVAMEDDKSFLSLMEVIAKTAPVRFIVINPRKHHFGEKSGGQCFQIAQIIAKLSRQIKKSDKTRTKAKTKNKKKGRKNKKG